MSLSTIMACWTTALMLAGALQALGGGPLPESALPLRLTGVVTDADKSRAACLIGCTASPSRHGIFLPGQVACDVAEIAEVRADGVVVRNLAADRLEWLALPSSPPPGGRETAPPRVALRQESRGSSEVVSVDLPKALVQHHLANLSEVLASAVAVPHYVDAAGGRRMDGFEITRVKPGGIAEQVGLRDGDVVVDVDGQPLDSMAAAMLLVARAPSLSNARLSVSRSGNLLNFVVSVK